MRAGRRGKRRRGGGWRWLWTCNKGPTDISSFPLLLLLLYFWLGLAQKKIENVTCTDAAVSLGENHVCHATETFAFREQRFFLAYFFLLGGGGHHAWSKTGSFWVPLPPPGCFWVSGCVQERGKKRIPLTRLPPKVRRRTTPDSKKSFFYSHESFMANKVLPLPFPFYFSNSSSSN